MKVGLYTVDVPPSLGGGYVLRDELAKAAVQLRGRHRFELVSTPRKLGLFEGERYPAAEMLAERGFYIPSGMALNHDQMDSVIASVRDALS